jgi:hypothetical protein
VLPVVSHIGGEVIEYVSLLELTKREILAHEQMQAAIAVGMDTQDLWARTEWLRDQVKSLQGMVYSR